MIKSRIRRQIDHHLCDWGGFAAKHQSDSQVWLQFLENHTGLYLKGYALRQIERDLAEWS